MKEQGESYRVLVFIGRKRKIRRSCYPGVPTCNEAFRFFLKHGPRVGPTSGPRRG